MEAAQKNTQLSKTGESGLDEPAGWVRVSTASGLLMEKSLAKGEVW